MAHDTVRIERAQYRIELPPHLGGSWTVAGDLDGDGQAEVVVARNLDANDHHYTCTVSAWKLDGRCLWWWGGPGAGRGELHHDVACQIHDWNGDGRLEVIVCDKNDLVELDGRSGRELRRIALPQGATDCLAFCDLEGRGHAGDVLVKNRYRTVWALDPDGKVRWTVHEPGGHRTAHQPFVYDLDGDGRDEVLCGLSLLDGDGNERWRLRAPDGVLESGHLDCCRLLRAGATPEETRLAFTYCSDLVLGVADGTGQVLWHHKGEHFESIDVGRVVRDRLEPQIVVDIDKAGWGDSPLRIYDETGELLREITTLRSRQHDLVDWTGNGVLDIPVAADQTVYDGEGAVVARWDMEPRDRPRAAFAADMTGNGIPDLLVSTWYGTAVYVFANHHGAQPSAPVPLGLPANHTLY